MRDYAPPDRSVYRWTPPSPEERAAELMRADRDARWIELKLYGFAILRCFAATTVGCVVAGCGFAVTDAELGRILLLTGCILSLAGNTAALWRLAVRVGLGEY